jgi:hypothetical protein
MKASVQNNAEIMIWFWMREIEWMESNRESHFWPTYLTNEYDFSIYQYIYMGAEFLSRKTDHARQESGH